MISPAVATLGDSALLLPASALLLIYLAILGQGSVAIALGASLVLAGAVTVAAKLLFHACGHAITPIDVVSPSGHASFATLFYGALAILLGTGRSPRARWGLAITVALVVLAVGISRVRTSAHSAAEVGIGLAIGLGGLAMFGALHARQKGPALPWRPIAIGFALALALLGGLHFSLEGAIGRLARRVSASFDLCAGPERSSGSTILVLGADGLRASRGDRQLFNQ